MLPAVHRPVLLVVVAMALAGCGGPSDEQQVAGTVSSFGRATAAKDYRALCERLLSPKLIEQVEEIGLPCEQALQKALGGVRNPRLTIGKVTVDGDTATAQIRTSATGQAPSSDVLRLVRVKNEWRIASLGS
jgi:hypothetical protein